MDCPRHAVRERDRNDPGLLGRQLARQPVRSRAPASAPDHDPRHGPQVQQASNVSVAHLRDTTAPRLAAGRVLLRGEAKPGGIAPGGGEVPDIRRRRGDDRGGRDTPGSVPVVDSRRSAGEPLRSRRSACRSALAFRRVRRSAPGAACGPLPARYPAFPPRQRRASIPSPSRSRTRPCGPGSRSRLV